MLKHILYLFALLGTLPLFIACTNELSALGEGYDADKEMPVNFTFLMPDASTMRGIENPKLRFENGDMIHVQGTFTTSKNGVEETVIRYGALTYNNMTWQTVAGSELNWPNLATKGSFKAYFVKPHNGVLKPDAPEVFNLSDITPQTDPLQAETTEEVQYGKAVRLTFKHLCAYLTLTDIEPVVAEQYWFVKEGLNNAFRINLNGNNQIEFEFCQAPDDNFYQVKDGKDMGLVYIACPIRTEDTPLTQASFFLQPGSYSAFDINYPALAPDWYEYLKYDCSRQESIQTLNLEAGNTYVLNVSKSPGAIVIIPPEGDGWDESDVYEDVDVKEFLKAAEGGTEYRNKEGTVILEKTNTGVKLLHNVNFNGAEYSLFDGFEPNIEEGKVFDGNYHYIRNLGCSLFRYNYGIIQNLGIKSIKATFVSDENDTSGKDMSRHGGLCMWNQANGIIENIRICDGVELTALVKTSGETESHNIGCVVGSNVGTMNGIALEGNFSLKVQGYPENNPNQVDASVMIGGIVGQNASGGSISDIGPDGDFKMTIVNECSGNQGAFYVGGIVGLNTASINNITLPNVEVDGTKSKGIVSYMGCIAGSLETTEAGDSGVEACNVSGSVKAGEVNPYGNVLQSVAYTGGFAGAVMRVPVKNCRVTASVYGTIEEKEKENVIYATGGAFGRIRTSTDMEDLVAYGSILQGPGPNEESRKYIGNFAGVIPEGQSWDIDYKGKGITVRKFSSYQEVGGTLPAN